MPIPDATNAIINREKLCEYLLDPDHPDGGTKATWFNTLGYDRDNWQQLATDLKTIAQTSDDFDVESTAFGLKYIINGMIGQTTDNQRRVLTVWITEPGKPPRLVTAYPATEK